MKQCRIIHINDGKPEEKSNGDFYFSECFPRMEEELESYLNRGFVVKSMAPVFVPGEPNGGYAFYHSGYLFYLEREVDDELFEPVLNPEQYLDDDPDEDF